MNLHKLLSVFMIALMLSVPFYVADVFAQNGGRGDGTGQAEQYVGDVPFTVPDPVQGCIEKHEETSGIVEFFDNGIINTLEKAISVLHFTCTAWNTVRTVVHLFQTGFGFASDGTCKLAFVPGGAGVCIYNDKQMGFMEGIGKVMTPICRLQECVLCNGRDGDVMRLAEGDEPFQYVLQDHTVEGEQDPVSVLINPDEFEGDIPQDGRVVYDAGSGRIQGFLPFLGGRPEEGKGGLFSEQGALGKYNDMMANTMRRWHINPHDNIYTALACMCPVGILTNIKKLKTIYQTYDCCIEQACQHGVGMETCEAQLSKATCMYWEGSIGSMFINIIMSEISRIVGKLLAEHISGLWGPASNFVKAVQNLLAAYQQIQGLMYSFQEMQRTLSGVTCEDLGFDQIEDERRAEFATIDCQLYQIDTNNDGIFDILETRCS